MAQVMQMDSLEASLVSRLNLDPAEIFAAQASTLRADKDQAFRGRVHEPVQVPAQLLGNLAGKRNDPAASSRLGISVE
jgi:hypothetical protein